MALCPPELTGWATRILDNLPETGGTSVSKIVSYLQYNLYDLNARIATSFYLNESGCILPDGMTPVQSGIYESMYRCNYYQQQSARNLGAAAYAVVQLDGHDQGGIRKASRVSVAEGWRQEAKICNEFLSELINEYNGGDLPAVGMVLYSCRGPNEFPLPFYGSPCWDYFSTRNSVFCEL